MKIPNPNNPVFIQKNNGVRDRTANLAGSFNVDLSRYPGKIIPAARLRPVLRQEDNSNVSESVSFAFHDSLYWTMGRKMFKTGGTGSILTTLTQDTITASPSPNAISDMVIFQDQLLVSRGQDIEKYGTSTWNTNWYTSLTGASNLKFTVKGEPHPLGVVQIGTPVLCIGDDNTMNTVVGTTATHPRLTLDVTQRIRWIVGGTSRAYIGCVNRADDVGESYVYEWDGGDTVPTRVFRIAARGVLSGVMMGDTLYIVDSNGAVQRLDGGGFRQVAEFPIFKDEKQPASYASMSMMDSFVGHKAMCVHNGKILINVKGGRHADVSSFTEYSFSGVWEFDPETGSLTHKHSPTLNAAGTLDFGQRVHGDSSRTGPGAIFETRDPRAESSIIVSGGYRLGSSTTSRAAIYVNDISENLPRRGKVITQHIESPALTNQWKITLKYDLMKNTGDRLVLKYRVNQSGNLPFSATATWVSATQFTSTNTNFQHVTSGDEIEVIQGNGGGCTAHVTGISEASGTYTVTLSETIVGVTAADTGIVRAHNWRFVESFNDQVFGYREFTILAPHSSTWLQALVELRSAGGDSPVLEEIDVVPTKQQ